MERKLLDSRKLYSTIALFFVFGGVVHFLFGFQPDPSVASPSPWSIHLVLYSMGFSLLILGVLSETTSLIGVDFYEVSDKTVRFAHFRNVIRFKFSVFILSILILVTGLYLNPAAFTVVDLTSFQDVRLAAGLLAVLLLMVQIIRSYLSLVRNREDYLEIGADRLRWYDNDDGAVKVLQKNEVKSITFVFESEAESPDVLAAKIRTASESYQIEFRRMSLLPHGRKIRQALEKFYAEHIEK